VPEQKLYLFQFSATIVAEPGTGTMIMPHAALSSDKELYERWAELEIKFPSKMLTALY
jgi:hypothetical protein